MRATTFSPCTWIYPDMKVSENQSAITLEIARGGMSSFQILTDLTLDENEDVIITWENIFSLKGNVYQLIPVLVDQNSGKDVLTGPYEAVKEFVTRKAPFYVFDAMREIDDGRLRKGRIAFYVKIEAPDMIQTGVRHFALSIEIGCKKWKISVCVNVHKARIPDLRHASFGMVNWLNIDEIELQHNVKRSDAAFDEILINYIDNELEMRNTQLQIPSGVPVRDENGKIASFDFSLAEKVGKAALDRGFQTIMGGFVARFHVWNENTHYLLWDKDVSVASHEGYRQLKIYFTEIQKLIHKNHWQGRYMQTLVDEPQFPNSDHYRILSSICRRFLPGVSIHDPVESTLLDGALDIWDVKQAVYEKYIDEYRALQDLDEEMWLYTCGFPAGKMMNRVMDLPLTASLLPMWMCYLYDCKGFLHWGYNVHNETPFEKTCYQPEANHPEIAYPAGNAHIVYPGTKGPMWSVRAMLQRIGAEDYELMNLLGKDDPNLSKKMILKACRSFSDYTFDGDKVDRIRKEILCELDK
ncbi:MAG: DUF4091 domain-containing protein [Clostridia bacterium]|nr:DUF4091 domain-containing protein [Clostridia bacterium]